MSGKHLLTTNYRRDSIVSLATTTADLLKAKIKHEVMPSPTLS